MIVVGSLAVHALAAVLLLTIDRSPHEALRSPHSIGLVEIAPLPTSTTPPVTATPGPEGGSRTVVVASRARQSRAPAAITKATAERDDGDPRGAISFDLGGDGESSGTGMGTGTGRGRGIGFGDGGVISPPPSTLVVPAPPPASKARPARLIFPSRQREVDDGELFVMKVTVDRDGYVAGAKLVRGFGGRRDEVASDQIWRFRYEPALDDGGHPIVSTVEQRFLVQ